MFPSASASLAKLGLLKKAFLSCLREVIHSLFLSLVRVDDDRNPPETDEERIIYFKFNNGLIPTSLLNQLIAECICHSVRRDDRLLW